MRESTGPAYRIVTPRLVIRCYDPTDAPLLKASVDASVEHLRPWMPWIRFEPQTLEQKVQLLRGFRGKFDLGQDFIYGIFDRDETRLLGGTGVHPRREPGAGEIGYWVHVDFQGQGLITEAAAALVRVSFEIDRLRRVEIRCAPANTRSGAVPQRLGFKLDGTLRQCIGEEAVGWNDAQVWTLLASEYPTSPAARAAVEAFDVVGERLPLEAPGD